MYDFFARCLWHKIHTPRKKIYVYLDKWIIIIGGNVTSVRLWDCLWKTKCKIRLITSGHHLNDNKYLRCWKVCCWAREVKMQRKSISLINACIKIRLYHTLSIWFDWMFVWMCLCVFSPLMNTFTRFAFGFLILHGILWREEKKTEENKSTSIVHPYNML